MLLIRKVAKHVFEKINVPENERNKELTEDELTKVERPWFLKRVHNLDGKPKYRNLVQRDIAWPWLRPPNCKTSYLETIRFNRAFLQKESWLWYVIKKLIKSVMKTAFSSCVSISNSQKFHLFFSAFSLLNRFLQNLQYWIIISDFKMVYILF